MAQTLSDIQIAVRHFTRNSELDLTAAEYLAMVNRIYRAMSVQFTWEELVTYDTSLATVANQEEYTWPAGLIYSDKLSIEIAGASPNAFIFGSPAAIFGTATFGGAATENFHISPAPSEYEWSKAKVLDAGVVPKFYKVYDVSGTLKVEFRPAPTTSSKTITLQGLKTPTELTISSSPLIFRDDLLNDALARLVAAEIFAKLGLRDDLTLQTQQAQAILAAKTSTEYVAEQFIGKVRGEASF